MTMSAPRTSFVIPARNAARTLARAFDSLIAQGDADWEALVIDDGSSDETPRLIAAQAQRDARFIALRGSGTPGVSAARNIGLAQARGQRVVFLDSDDWIDRTFLDRMHAALDAAPGAAAAYCDYRRVMPDGGMAPACGEPDVARAPFDTFARTCAVAIHAVLIEREWVLRAGGFDSTLATCEDWDLWQRVARLGSRWVHVAEPLALYRTAEHSLSRDIDRVLADAAVVIGRGFGPDPRLPDGANAHANGATAAPGFSAAIALAYCTLWCLALDAARGRDRPRQHAALAALPRGSEHAADITATLLDGVSLGLCAAPAQLAARWAEYGQRIGALIDALGAQWADAAAARLVHDAFERLVQTSSQTLVSVVIPAHNAAATLDATLHSARAQSHRELEIIVVDDGSTDGTPTLAAQHAAADDRVRIVTQRNAGVAAARNTGWQAARSDVIAFLDADDLWAPTKIERQLQALRAAGPRAGLVYCWYHGIDARGLITDVQNSPAWQGDVLHHLLHGNFIGNGSAALVRREALVESGGFDATLRARGAQGCEDYLLYCRIAGSFDFALVADHLVGYRSTPGNMSSDRPRMLRSWLLVADEMRARHDNEADAVLRGVQGYAGWLVGDALAHAAHGQVPRLLMALARRHPTMAVRVIVNDLLRPTASRLLGRTRRRPARPMNARIGAAFPVGGRER
jgi:glycosyltransferase involved in cell wall biosynthesis